MADAEGNQTLSKKICRVNRPRVRLIRLDADKVQPMPVVPVDERAFGVHRGT